MVRSAFAQVSIQRQAVLIQDGVGGSIPNVKCEMWILRSHILRELHMVKFLDNSKIGFLFTWLTMYHLAWNIFERGINDELSSSVCIDFSYDEFLTFGGAYHNSYTCTPPIKISARFQHRYRFVSWDKH